MLGTLEFLGHTYVIKIFGYYKPLMGEMQAYEGQSYPFRVMRPPLQPIRANSKPTQPPNQNAFSFFNIWNRFVNPAIIQPKDAYEVQDALNAQVNEVERHPIHSNVDEGRSGLSHSSNEEPDNVDSKSSNIKKEGDYDAKARKEEERLLKLIKEVYPDQSQDGSGSNSAVFQNGWVGLLTQGMGSTKQKRGLNRA